MKDNMPFGENNRMKDKMPFGENIYKSHIYKGLFSWTYKNSQHWKMRKQNKTKISIKNMGKRIWTGISPKKIHRCWMKEIRQKRVHHVQFHL